MSKFEWLRLIRPTKNPNGTKCAVIEYSIADPKINLPAGTYYIGDPCYVIKDEEWAQALYQTNFFNMFPSTEATTRRNPRNPKHLMNGVFLYKKKSDTHVGDEVSTYHFAASSTKYGDGCYECRENEVALGECEVDAGLISAISIEMIKNCGEESGLALGVVHDFTTPFQISYFDGAISFGSVTVETGREANK